MHKHCIQMKDHKGKTTGLMMEGSAMHMSMLHRESAKQEKKDLLKDMPVDDKASAIEMSPYKMDHGSPAKQTGGGKSKEGGKIPSKPKAEADSYDPFGPTGGFGPTEPTATEIKNKQRKDLYKGMKSPDSKPKNAKEYKSPATFTGMSGGSALHQEGDPDLSDMANLLFGEKKITKKQAKKAKEQVLANPMAKDTLKTEKKKKVETKK